MILRDVQTTGDSHWLLALPVTSCFVFPLVYAAVAYLRLPSVLSRFCKIAESGSPLEKHAQHAARVLGLRLQPHVLFSVHQKMPTVFTRWGLRPALILPTHFTEATEDAVSGKRDLVDPLVRFVVLHELAHVRNGDCEFMSWITALSRAAKWWVVSILITIVYLLAVFGGKRELLMIAIGFLWPLLCVFTLFWITYRSIASYREYLADARAFACMPPEESWSLFQKTEDGLSVLERLPIHLGLRHMFTEKRWRLPLFHFLGKQPLERGSIKARVGNALTSRYPRINKVVGSVCRFVRTHPGIEERNQALLDGKYLCEAKAALSCGSAMLVFLAVGLSWLMALATVLVASRLKLVSEITTILTILTLTAACCIAIILSLPLRNAATSAVPIPKEIAGILLRAFVGGLALWAGFAFVLLPFVFVGHAEYAGGILFLGRFSVFLAIAAGTLAMLLGAFIRLGNSLQMLTLEPPGKLLIHLAICLAIFTPVLIFSFIAFQVIVTILRPILPMDWQLMGFMWALVPAVAVAALFSRRILRSSSDLPPRQMAREIAWSMVAFLPTFLVLCFPCVWLASLISRKLSQTPWTLRDTAGLIFVLLSMSGFLLAALVSVRRQRESQPYWAELACLAQTLSIEMALNFRNQVKNILSKCQPTAGGYAYAAGARADLKATRHALRGLAAVQTNAARDYQTSAWIASHLTTEGAYARRPGKEAAMGATFAAIDSLRTMNTLSHGDATEGIARWIAHQQDMSGGFRETATSKRPILLATSCAVRCLAWLRATHFVNTATASEFLTCQWRQSRKTLAETHLATSALDALGSRDPALRREIQQWVRNNLPRILMLRTDCYAQALGLYVEIARVAFRETPDELATIESHVKSKVEHAIARFVESNGTKENRAAKQRRFR
jgi:hypothetical protein